MKLESRVSIVSAILTVFISGCSQLSSSRAVDSNPSETFNDPDIPSIVTALGRIEPKDKVIHLSGPSQLFNGRVIDVYVEEGETVESGQLIAIFDNFHSEKSNLKSRSPKS